MKMKYGVYHGCHNSFVITDDVANENLSELAIEYCRKHETDGFIVPILNPLEMVFYNADGTKAPMCGNGIRCMIRHCYEQGYIDLMPQTVKTLGGMMQIEITSVEPFMVKVNFGLPSYDPKKLAILSEKEHINSDLIVGNQTIKISSIFLGTHHAVVFVNDDEIYEHLGSLICNHPFYTEKVNVNFAKIIDRKNIKVHTYERGVGWTLACGTGGSSSFAIAHRLGLVDDEVIVHFVDGFINVSINDKKEIFMEGPAEKIQWFE